MRRCRLKSCRAELPSVKESNHWQKQNFCNVDHMAAHGLAKARQQQERKKLKEKQQSRKEVRELKAQDYSYQFGLTKKAAQKLANRLDEYAGYGCISCGTQKNVQYCGGHFKTAGGHSEIALDIRNIMRQCNRYCNSGLSGNINGNKTSKGYEKGIIERYGQVYLDWLESYHAPKNYTCDELKKMRAEFAAECRNLEAGHGPSRDWRALDINSRRAAA